MTDPVRDIPSTLSADEVSGPVRTCIATRRRHRSSDLVRCRVTHDTATHGVQILPDPAGRLPGRGAWITPTQAAVDLAIERRAFQRAFTLKTNTVNVDALRDYIAEWHARQGPDAMSPLPVVIPKTERSRH